MSDLTLEDLLIYEGRDYKLTAGASGDQLNIRECPRCGKDKWKVYANAESSLGNCFSCGRDGNFNLFRFASWLLQAKGGQGANADVGRYLTEVRRKLGYRPRQQAQVKVAVEQGDVELPTSAPIPNLDGKNHPYLEERGISGDYAAAFHLRFSLFGSHRYKNAKGEDVSQDFSNRILIPVYDLDGQLKTFQGRDVTGASDIRYKFAGGLPGTARYLYNGHTVRGLHAEHAVMVEGAFDTIPTQIALDQLPGYEKSVAIGTFGMELSRVKEGDDQVGALTRLKREGLRRVTLMWDGEPEAYERAIDAAMVMTSIGLDVAVAALPKPPPGAGFKSYDPGMAGVSVIGRALDQAQQVTRISAMRMRMRNPYK